MVSTASTPEAAASDAAREQAAVGAPGSPVRPRAACGGAAGGLGPAAQGSAVPSGSCMCWVRGSRQTRRRGGRPCRTAEPGGALLLDLYQSGNNVRNCFRNNFSCA